MEYKLDCHGILWQHMGKQECDFIKVKKIITKDNQYTFEADEDIGFLNENIIVEDISGEQELCKFDIYNKIILTKLKNPNIALCFVKGIHDCWKTV